MKTNWDYSERAKTYDMRADYSLQGITKLLEKLGCKENCSVADIGAGTGKLSIPLHEKNLNVISIEPNNNMRNIGIANTESTTIQWIEGTGEDTKLKNNSVEYAFFGSSFNVVDHKKSLDEVNRILKPLGGFACMWNHRDLNDETQKSIENIIKKNISNYEYGSRRIDPTQVIENCGYFQKVECITEHFNVLMKTSEIIEAWESHETLYRQSGKSFNKIIMEISDFLNKKSEHIVPYSTKIWYSRLKK